MNANLVKFKNLDGLNLDGIYFHSHHNSSAIIHVHGSFGNFYSNPFISIMGDIYCSAGYNLLSFNLTQHDGIAEAVREVRGVEKWEYIGYSVSDYNSCLADIAGAIRFLQSQGVFNIILQGHSMGCNRVLYYLIEKNIDFPIILLSPTNSLELQRRWIYPESIEDQLTRLRRQENNQKSNMSILFGEHGVRTENECTDGYIDDVPFIPISASALVSILENPSMDILKLIQCANSVSNSAFIYFGGKDDYQTEKLDHFMYSFTRFFKSVDYLEIEDGNHSFSGYEETVATSIIKWLRKI